MAGRWAFRGVGLIFLFAAIMSFVHGVQQITVSVHARNWPVATGTVMSSRMHAGGPEIQYIFAVDGKEYRSQSIHVGPYKGIESHAREFVRRYPAGATTRVYHHPKDPGRSVLEHRFPWTSLILLFMGSGLLFAAWICFRQRRALSEILLRAADGSAC